MRQDWLLLQRLLSRQPFPTRIRSQSCRSRTCKGEKIEIADIAKRLNVAHVLEGSVRTSGNKGRITAQLVRASDSTHLWSEG